MSVRMKFIFKRVIQKCVVCGVSLAADNSKSICSYSAKYYDWSIMYRWRVEYDDVCNWIHSLTTVIFFESHLIQTHNFHIFKWQNNISSPLNYIRESDVGTNRWCHRLSRHVRSTYVTELFVPDTQKFLIMCILIHIIILLHS